MKWEYHVEWNNDLSAINGIKKMNDLGAKGWEIVGVASTTDYKGIRFHELIFKRPLSN